MHSSEFLRFLVRHFAGYHQFLDPLRHGSCLCLDLLEIVAFFRLFGDQKLRLQSLTVRILRSHMKRSGVIVFNAADLPAHHPLKHLIDGLYHIFTAPEILGKIDPPAVSLRLVGLIFLHKEFRSRQAEAINALLHVAHHKAVIMPVLLSGDRAQQVLLHKIAVLILIDQYLTKVFPVLQCHLTWNNAAFLLL